MWSLSAAQRAIIIAGCLGTAYQQLILSPANVEFATHLGATGLHIGILNALPFLTLAAQFIAAIVVNQLEYRRTVWMTLSVIHRLLFVPLTIAVLLLPEVESVFWLWAFIGTAALNHALLQFCTPLWMSWMGDYLPHEGLSHYWGVRQRWMHWSAAFALAGSAVLLFQFGLTIKVAFASISIAGGLIGVVDVLLFTYIDEPPVTPSQQPSLWEVFAEPFRHEGYQSYISYACYWNFATMIAAPFISLYLLQVAHLSLYAVLLLWAASWVGGALVAGRLGYLCEEFGNRPVLIVCTAFKTVNMLALLFLPTDPTWAFWILVPTFMGDQALNSGITIASNTFMLKHSPQQNRTMYIAAGTAFAGMVGGVTGICAGATLEQLTGWSYSLGGWVVNGFHILFGISIAFRLGGVVLAYRIHDPGATDWSTLIEYLIWGTVRDTKLAIRLGLLAQELAPEQDTSPASIMLHRSPIVDLVRPTAAAATAKPVVPSPKPIEAATPVPPPHVPIPVRIDGPSTGAPSAPLTVSRASPE